MDTVDQLKFKLEQGELTERLAKLYGFAGSESVDIAPCIERIRHLLDYFDRSFNQTDGSGKPIALFSAPGRTEIGGNHTDHQHGRVLAASVTLDSLAAARTNDSNLIRVQSEGYDLDTIDLADCSIHPEEINTSAALVRGIAARFLELGYPVRGFDVCLTSTVLKGSGLSSSAAFEVLIGNILNTLFADGRVDAVSIAQIGQFAENHYYGKPCGLMDQMASSIGGVIGIDFQNPDQPQIDQIQFDIAAAGYALCIIDTGADHRDLTAEYASIPEEMGSVAACFDKSWLRDVDSELFMASIPRIRQIAGDRAVLRAMHFFAEDFRVTELSAALHSKNIDRFLQLILESGHSSATYLQNITATGATREQSVALVLALCDRYLSPIGGAWRVHGGGFAGTVQAFVPISHVESFKRSMEQVLGTSTCHVLSIRPIGGCCIIN